MYLRNTPLSSFEGSLRGTCGYVCETGNCERSRMIRAGLRFETSRAVDLIISSLLVLL
jgi:hypothetical protein